MDNTNTEGQQMEAVQMFQVVKLHTAGNLVGLTTTETTRVSFSVGFVCAKAIGGGSYRVVSCERIA